MSNREEEESRSLIELAKMGEVVAMRHVLRIESIHGA